MLRINVFKGSGGVINYYNNTLEAGDYYMSKDGMNQAQEIVGNWYGKLAEGLKLSGQVTKENFYKLTNNINPSTGQELTMRTVGGRRVGFDFNFHVPKSFSLVHALHNDKRLTDVFREAVKETMEEMEKLMETRIRKGGQSQDRKTGSMVWGEFIHFTARPVGGVPDPHLHAHCFAFNATFDDVEGVFKAGQFVNIKRSADLSQAEFHARLMAKTRALGYEVRLKPKGWEIDGVPQSVIDRFSRRTQQVEDQAKKLGVIDDKGKEKLGATTREKKTKQTPMSELKALWEMQMTSQEKEALELVRTQADKNYFKNNTTNKEEILREAVNLSLDDILERESTASQKSILKKALLYGKGSIDTKDIIAELDKREAERGLLSVDLDYKGKYYTTKKVLAEEKNIVELINSGRGKYAKMPLDQTAMDQELYPSEQKEAVKMLFNSTDAVVSIRGGAGSGKSTLLQLATRKIKEAGKQPYIFAPSSQASRGVLRSEGFSNADTVAKYLQNEELQHQTKGQIIVIDEAGLLSVPELKAVLTTARENKARLLLIGDIKQHSSVERGDALRLAESKTNMERAELTTTRRQLVEEYKKAVSEIRDGQTAEGFNRLDQMGAIIENEKPLERFEAIAKEYTNLLYLEKNVLVVSPTHAEGSAITEKIRTRLKARQLLGEEEKAFEVLGNRNLTEVERQPEFLQDGDTLQFFKDFDGIKKGQKYQVHTEKNQDGSSTRFVLGDDKAKIRLGKDWAKYYNVYTPHTIKISKNEKIQITQNGIDRLGQTLLNGQSLTVQGFDYNGRILAVDEQGNPKHLPAHFQNFNYGYVSTSHASQGKTADVVLIGQSSASFSASDQKQFYVSVSRGREAVKIFTNNKEELKEAITPTKNRFSALELMDERMQQAKEQAKRLPTKSTEPTEPTKEEPQTPNFINPFVRTNPEPTPQIPTIKTWSDILQTVEPQSKNNLNDKKLKINNTSPLPNSGQVMPEINPFAPKETTISKSRSLQTLEEYQKKQKSMDIDMDMEI